MVANWIDDSVDIHQFISFPTPSLDERFQVFQRVGAHDHIKLVKSFKDDYSKVRAWNVQPYSVFQEDALPTIPSAMDIFPAGEPMTMDILKFLAQHTTDRTQINISCQCIVVSGVYM